MKRIYQGSVLYGEGDVNGGDRGLTIMKPDRRVSVPSEPCRCPPDAVRPGGTLMTRATPSGFSAAAVSVRVGYESPSQFSREYSRFFGRSPGRDTAELAGAWGIAD